MLDGQKKEVHPGFEPGLLEDGRKVKIQSDNHYTNEPYSRNDFKETTNTMETTDCTSSEKIVSLSLIIITQPTPYSILRLLYLFEVLSTLA